MRFATQKSLTLAGRSTLRVYPAGSLKDYPHKPIDASPVHEQTVNNLVVLSGKELVADLLLDQETVGLTYHAIGTASAAPVAGDTDLGAEANRKPWTTRFRVGKIITFEVFYLAGESTHHIRECGVFGGSTASATADSGRLFSRYMQDYDNSAGLYDLTFEYELTIG